jgi:small redox-active disulfide protein 2
MIHVQVMGPGTTRCHETVQLIHHVVAENNIDVTVELVTDFQTMIEQNVFAIPSIIIEDKIRSVGRVPQADELLRWLEDS